MKDVSDNIKKTSKDKNPKADVKIDFEPEMCKEDLEYIFDGDLSDVDLPEHVEIVEQTKSELDELTEVLSAVGRLRLRSALRRSKERILRARQRALSRRATNDKILKRARHSAIEKLKFRFSGGRDPSDLSFSERGRIERMVSKRKKSIDRSARKIARKKRQLETERLSRR